MAKIAKMVINIGRQGLPGETDVISCQSGQILGGHRVVRFHDNDKLYYADALVIDDMNSIVGVTTHACQIDSLIKVRRYGLMIEDTWSWIKDKPIFLNTSGLLTQTEPLSGFIKVIGYAVSENSMFVELQQAFKI